MATKKKFYVVWEGRTPGVYSSWDTCKKNIEGFAAAKYKSFTSKAEADTAFKSHYSNHISAFSKGAKKTLKISHPPTHNPIRDSISVDAACSGNPGKMEYKGVDTTTKTELFIMGPYADGTNNIGEFLAIVHALAYLKKCELPNKIIYSDSQIAIGWVKKKKCGTKLAETSKNAILFELIDRAESWLQNNTYKNPIHKWETEIWGENPADFGRK
jgi:ribonuclease HI